MAKAGPKGFTFHWTDDEWAVLEPLEEAERFNLMMRALMSGRSLLAQARIEGLTQGGRAD